uniref:BESS domain-containing protein n=1 Tax=Timema shepardi TaxID=629360 RepID=A0A7R9AVW1_TIMSH|nr:unnamed protein product [Timema shepardi]
MRGKEVKSKWKNLRTCFKRELGAQKRAISGKNGKKRRKYIYFDQLLFLLPSLEDRKTKSNPSPSSIDINEAQEESNTEESEITEIPPNARRKKETKIDLVESLLQILQKKQEEEKDIDEDQYFLRSLLPSFKKFNDEQKLTARIEILKVLRRMFCLTTGPSLFSVNLYSQRTQSSASTFSSQNGLLFFIPYHMGRD